MFKKAKQLALGRRASSAKQRDSGGLSGLSSSTAVTPDAMSPGLREHPGQPPTHHQPAPTHGNLPTIKVHGEDAGGLHALGEKKLCETCGPLTACTEQPVSTIDIFRSADGQCYICLLFSSVCLLADSKDSVGYLSSWSGSKGGFGVYLITKIIEGGIQRPGITVAVVVLAVDGGKSLG